MPRTRCTLTYKYDELPDSAKAAARNWYQKYALEYEWWDYIYSDAAQVGLKITSFNLDKLDLRGHLTMPIADSISAILGTHGEACNTHRLATQFRTDLHGLARNSPDYRYLLDELTECYQTALCEEYRRLLQAECDWLLADAQIEDSIRMNEYEFTEKGGPHTW